MEQNREEGWRGFRVLVVGLLLVGVVVALMCVIRVNLLRNSMYRETERYLGEVSSQIADQIDQRMEGIFAVMSTAGEICQERDRPRDSLPVLRVVAESNHMVRMGVAGMDGWMYTTDGYRVDVSGEPVIQRALRGELAVSDVAYSPVDGSEAVIYAVPLWKDGLQTGVLAGSSLLCTMRSYLGVESFEGEGYSVIVNRQGDVVMSTESKNAPDSALNLFEDLEQGKVDRGWDAEQVRADMEADRSGILYYALNDGIHKTMVYQPLGYNEWYLLSVVPTDAAGAEVGRVVLLAVAVDGIIVLLFLALILLVSRSFSRQQRELERVAYCDPVTQGRNRAYFTREAEKLIREAPSGTYALVSMDVEKFKLINDTFGSEMGDRTLKYIHDVIAARLDGDELLARISGDVFKLLLKGGDKDVLEGRLRGMAEEINAFNEGRQDKYLLTLAEGVYVVDEPGLNIVTIQGRANEAREYAKQEKPGGVNVCAFYTADERSRMVREKEIENRMEAALAAGEFEVYLQPKVELRWNSVAGAEALVRWRDRSGELLPPGEFIPLFERNGFIVKIDLFVFEQVCGLLRKWLDEGRRPVPISVNLSRIHLRSLDILAPYDEILARYGVPPELIEFELTETVAFENTEALKLVLNDFHRRGYRCSLDDFGSGYSSLNMLKDLDIDVIKLDRSFFSAEEDSDRGDYVVQSVLELARRLKIQTVCEGVERPRQAEFLRRANCDMVQGFVFARPMPVEDFERLAFSGRPVPMARTEKEDLSLSEI